MSKCWKSHVVAQIIVIIYLSTLKLAITFELLDQAVYLMGRPFTNIYEYITLTFDPLLKKINIAIVGIA